MTDANYEFRVSPSYMNTVPFSIVGLPTESEYLTPLSFKAEEEATSKRKVNFNIFLDFEE